MLPVQRTLPSILLISIPLLVAGCNFPAQDRPLGSTTPEPPDALQDQPPSEDLDPADPVVAASETAEPEQSALFETPAPVLEPPRLRIAYAHAGDLWALEVGSQPVQLTHGNNVGEVRLTDDGEFIFYVSWNADRTRSQIRSVPFGGAGDRSLFSFEAFDSLYPLQAEYSETTFIGSIKVIPGTRRALFNTFTGGEGPGARANADLFVIHAEGGQARRLVEVGDGGEFHVSPDDQTIAVVQPDGIGFVQADGTGLHPDALTYPRVITYSEFSFYPLPVWDGDSLIVPVPPEDPFFGDSNGTVWRVPSDGSHPVLLASPPGDLYGSMGEAPLVSPDATTLAYIEFGEEAALVLHPLSVGEPFVFDTSVGSWKGWSPDSARFAYSVGIDLKIGVVGGSVVELGPGTGLRWIDSERYLYLAGPPGEWTLTLGGLDRPSVALLQISDPETYSVSYDFTE